VAASQRFEIMDRKLDGVLRPLIVFSAPNPNSNLATFLLDLMR
jgi:hypothetical protein